MPHPVATFCLTLTIAVSLAEPGLAQERPPAEPARPAPAPARPAAPSEPAPDSPQAAVRAYLTLAREGRFEEAARYLDIPPSERDRAAELAERLKRVLDHRTLLDPKTLSAESSGDEEDGLYPGVDEVTKIPGPAGPQPVRVTRVTQGATTRWVFTRGTVRHIDAWYDQLEQKWLFENLPPMFLRAGPWEILLWQWVALALFFMGAWIVGMLLSLLTRAVLGKLVRNTRTSWDDRLLASAKGPLTLAWTSVSAVMALPWIGLPARAEASFTAFLRALLLLALFWGLSRSLTVGASWIGTWALQYPVSRSLVPLGTRMTKALLVSLALVATLAQLGYPVASLIAGLGIGGLAVALAAQKTVENLFGAFSLGVDQPFRQGDYVRVEDVTGTIETIGLRSTKIRTLNRTVVSIPNGKLADMRIESYAPRDRIRLVCTIALTPTTPADQIRRILKEVERVLLEHPKIWKESVSVRLQKLGTTSLDVKVQAWFETTSLDEFTLLRQEVFLEFLTIIERVGAR